jgi:hypothetical protein
MTMTETPSGDTPMTQCIRLVCYSLSGGHVTLRQTAPYGVSGGATRCTQAEYDAYKKARLLADLRNGGDMTRVRAVLEAAGFEVFVE